MLLIKHNEAKKIKDIFKVIETFATEIEIVCNEEGFKIVAIDGSHVCMINMLLPPSYFEKYEVNESYSLKIDCENFVKILEAHRSNDSITFSFDRDSDALHISMNQEGKRKIRNFSFNLLDEIDLEDINIENILSYPFQNKTEIDPNILESSLKAATIFSEILEINITDCEDGKELSFRYVGNLGEGEDIIDPDDLENTDFKENGSWKYTIKFLKDIIKSKTFSTKTSISFGFSESEEGEQRPLPIRFDFDLGNDAILNFFLAPRKSKPDQNFDDDDEDYEDYDDEEE